jgi:glutathione S-transferase
MEVKLYTLRMSNPGHAASAMLESKGIAYRATYLLPGIHHRLMRLRGFKRPTVPALRIDGQEVQGTREIARKLDELVPDPPLFPADPSARVAVEDAERWADEELQNTPRRILRLSGARSQPFRRWFAREIEGVPLPGIAAAINVTEARRLARVVDAGEERTRRELAELPATVDRVDRLIADEVIGGESPKRRGLPDRLLDAAAACNRSCRRDDRGAAGRCPRPAALSAAFPRRADSLGASGGVAGPPRRSRPSLTC